jgi:hypothetical protein
MAFRSGGMVLAVVATAFMIAPGLSAAAQFNGPGFVAANASDRMGGGAGKGATAKATTGKKIKSKADERMGGGAGKGGPGKTKRMNPIQPVHR